MGRNSVLKEFVQLHSSVIQEVICCSVLLTLDDARKG